MPASRIVSEWPGMDTVPLTRPAMVSGSSAAMSPVMMIEGPISDAVCMAAPLLDAPAMARVVPCDSCVKPARSREQRLRKTTMTDDIVDRLPFAGTGDADRHSVDAD